MTGFLDLIRTAGPCNGPGTFPPAPASPRSGRGAGRPPACRAIRARGRFRRMPGNRGRAGPAGSRSCGEAGIPAIAFPDTRGAVDGCRDLARRSQQPDARPERPAPRMPQARTRRPSGRAGGGAGGLAHRAEPFADRPALAVPVRRPLQTGSGPPEYNAAPPRSVHRHTRRVRSAPAGSPGKARLPYGRTGGCLALAAAGCLAWGVASAFRR